jgi:hypothetical protein
MYVGLHVNVFYFCPILGESGKGQIFLKIPNIEFHENSSRDNRAFQCRNTSGQVRGQTGGLKDIMQLSSLFAIALRQHLKTPVFQQPSSSNRLPV